VQEEAHNILGPKLCCLHAGTLGDTTGKEVNGVATVFKTEER
jgi:hypothetical protein